MRASCALAFATLFLSLLPGWAQEIEPAVPQIPTETTDPVPPSAAEPVTPPPAIPTVSPDAAIFRRSPTVDGQIEPGEWDEYFTFEYTGLRASAYINWDDSNLYVASKSSAPTDLLVILDANCDGWFHGSDNYEFIVRRAEGNGSATLSVSRYESRGVPGGGTPLTAAEASTFTTKAGSAPDSYVYELAIPRSSVVGLNLRPQGKIGLKVAIGAGSGDVQWIPSAPLGEVQTAVLVTSKSSGPDSLKLDVRVRDDRLSPGEELVAKLSVKNVGTSDSAVDTLIVGGEGKTAKLLGSQLVRLETIKPGKSFTTTFRSPIPHSASAGSNALGVELRSGENRIAASLVSFDIAPRYKVKLELPEQPVKRGEYHRIAVVVTNNTQSDAYGKVRLSLPDGWQFRRSTGVKEFHIWHEDGEQAVVFRVKPPDGAQGRAPVLAELEVGEHVLSASGILEVR